jgi:hypothetical protein
MYIEIKTKKKLGLTEARKIISKNCISAVITTGEITPQAKHLFDEHDIAYAEKIPETEFTKSQAQEE